MTRKISNTSFEVNFLEKFVVLVEANIVKYKVAITELENARLRLLSKWPSRDDPDRFRPVSGTKLPQRQSSKIAFDHVQYMHYPLIPISAAKDVVNSTY